MKPSWDTMRKQAEKRVGHRIDMSAEDAVDWPIVALAVVVACLLGGLPRVGEFATVSLLGALLAPGVVTGLLAQAGRDVTEDCAVAGTLAAGALTVEAVALSLGHLPWVSPPVAGGGWLAVGLAVVLGVGPGLAIGSALVGLAIDRTRRQLVGVGSFNG